MDLKLEKGQFICDAKTPSYYFFSFIDIIL